MEIQYVKIAGVILGIITGGTVIFQILLALGLPLGEYAYGGQNKVLPKKLRISCIAAVLILVFMGLVFLQKSTVIDLPYKILNSNILLGIFSFYLLFNTILNFLSKSKKEKLVMGPITIIGTIAAFIILFK